MADDDPGEASTVIPEAGGKAKVLPGKNAATRQKILVASGVGVLILTLLLLRSRSSSAAASSGTAAQTATTATGSIDPSTGVPYAQELANSQATTGYGLSALDPSTGQPYATELATAQGQISGLTAQLEGYSGTGTTVAPTSPTSISGNGGGANAGRGHGGGSNGTHGHTGSTTAAS